MYSLVRPKELPGKYKNVSSPSPKLVTTMAKYIRLSGKQVADRMRDIFADSICFTIEANNCNGCDRRVKEARKLLNALKG